MFTRQEIKEQSKAQMSGKIWSIFGVTLLAALIGSAANMICSIIPVVGAVGTYFVSAGISLGIITIYLNITYGDDVRLEDLFTNLNRILPATLLLFLQGLFVFLWSLLLIVPGIIMGIAYSMSWFIFMENPELDTMTCIKKSKEMMNGHKMDYFVLCLSFFPWILLCMVTFGIAGIYVYPYMSLAKVNFYHKIKGEIDLPCNKASNNSAEVTVEAIPVQAENTTSDTISAPVFPDVNTNEAFNDPFADITPASETVSEADVATVEEAAVVEVVEAADVEAVEEAVEETAKVEAVEETTDDATADGNDSVYF